MEALPRTPSADLHGAAVIQADLAFVQRDGVPMGELIADAGLVQSRAVHVRMPQRIARDRVVEIFRVVVAVGAAEAADVILMPEVGAELQPMVLSRHVRELAEAEMGAEW